MSNELKVSISCITYNHAAYITECLDGFLMQQCDFAFEVLIHDDASTDGTSDIIRAYQSRYPDIIKPIIQEENQWSKGKRSFNARYNFPRAQGKYIALCEGDDYWTDPLKLQKQVDFLERNQEYVLCHTDVLLLIDGELVSNNKFKQWNYLNSELNYKNSIFYPIAFTCTALFRNFNDKNIYPKNKITSGDWFLWNYLNLKGKSKFLNDITSVYRTNVGISKSTNWINEYKSKGIILLKFISLKLSTNKNYWLTRGALYYFLEYYNHIFFRGKISFITKIIKKQINENR